MNLHTALETPGNQNLALIGHGLTQPDQEEQPPSDEVAWRRVLGVMLVEGEMRYLVEREQ